MKVLIVDNGSSYLSDLTKLFSEYNLAVTHINDIDVSIIKPQTLVVLSGGHALPVVWHNKFYAKELSLIRSYTGPILGICLGFELIAHAYGNHLSFLPRRAHLKRLVTVTPAGRRYLSTPQFIAFESHRYALRHATHPLISLATTKNGVEIIRHATKNIFAVQFHPEKFYDEQGKIAFSELLGALGTPKDKLTE